MPCGCTSACGCNLVPGENVSIDRLGDTFTISATGAIVGVESTDCIDLVIDVDKVLSASPILSPDPTSVDLECTPSGIAASVVVDPSSTAIVTEGPDGLRVDIPPAPGGGGEIRPGDLIFVASVGFRPEAIDADGQEVLRASYPACHDALSLIHPAGERIAGDPTITGINNTRFVEVGMPLEATGFPFGTTVAGKTGTTITASLPADDSGVDTEVRVYPWGNGDGIDTFNVPDMNRRYPRGYDYIGGDELGTLDEGGTTIGLGNLPEHDHPATASTSVTIAGAATGISATGSDSGHVHGIDASGNHQHDGAGANHDFIVENSTVDYVYLDVVAVNLDTANTFRMTTNGLEGGDSYKPNREGNTYPAGNHDHGGATDSGTANITVGITDPGHGHAGSTAATTVDVELGGGVADPDPIEVEPRNATARWMVVV
jgi:hypothetical protein